MHHLAMISVLIIISFFSIYKIATLFSKQASRLLLFLPVLQHLQFSGQVKLFSNKIRFILYFRGPSCKGVKHELFLGLT